MSSSKSSVPIIRTKLHRHPVTADYIARDALVASLEAGFELPLTVVSAPAGYGKSTVVSHWLEAKSHPHGWLSLDESDSDTRVFLTYCVAALHTALPETCEGTLDLVESVNLPPLSTITTQLINDIDELDERVVLVLDDYHRIRQPDIHSILDRLLEHPSPRLHLVIMSRVDPFLSLTSLRVRHAINEIRMGDLEFSARETSSFLGKAIKHAEEASIIDRLQEKTEGWPAGIRLVALALKRWSSVEDFLNQSFADIRPLQEYLVGEVLSGQPPIVQDCLLKTSILNRFNAALCEAVWSNDFGTDTDPIDGWQFIEVLENSGLFCIALDETGNWFRYHHLFGDLLRRQLLKTQSSEKISDLHQRASSWFAENKYFEEAIQHALNADDDKGAADIIGNARHELMNRDQWHRLERWLGLFQDETVEKQPQLLMLRCWLDMNQWHRADLLSRDLDRVDALLETPGTEATELNSLKAEAVAFRSNLAYWTLDPGRAVTLAGQALRDSPIEQECVRSTALMMQAAAHQMLGDGNLANRLLWDHIESGPLQSPNSQARLLQGLCFLYWFETDTRKLFQSASRLAEISLEHEQSWSLSYARYFLGLVHYECNELSEAAAQLESVFNEPYRYPMQNVAHSSFLLSLSYQALGLPDRAREIAQSIADFTLKSGNKEFFDLVAAFQADLDLRQGRITQADQWMENFTLPVPHAMTRFFNESLTAIRVTMARDTPEDRKKASEQLTSMHELVHRTHHRRFMIDVLGMRALLTDAEGDTGEAVTLLKDAVLLGQPGQLIRPLTDLGRGIDKLLNRLDLNQEGENYAGMIFSALRGSVQEEVSPEFQPLAEPLSQRELEILGLLAKNMSNTEIADKLFISIGTVKRHAHNIYGKLSVSGRREAVTKARNLALLKSG